MCGIGGILNLAQQPEPDLGRCLAAMNELQRHRGPDGHDIWVHPRGAVGFAHRRLSIIDLEAGRQPMHDGCGNWITFNGEIYNYRELRDELSDFGFRTHSDTEVILHAYRKWGPDCVSHLRGMFAFMLWDDREQRLFGARDRFGIKPLYHTRIGDRFIFASEIKALLPFVDQVEMNLEGLADYLTFQFCLHGKTLFKGIEELQPGHSMLVANGAVQTSHYWQVYYNIDFDHTPRYFQDRVSQLLADTIDMHLRSDVPVGAYLSGGLDSSLVTSLAVDRAADGFEAYVGKFSVSLEYDESRFARQMAEWKGFSLRECDITAADFVEHLPDVIYHLDQPVAGPGSFAQYMVSRLAARHRKVVLGGQGGDEIFGGYTRYLIAYFEQCIKGAIDGTMNSGNFVVTYESIIPNLTSLRNYKPLLKQFWSSGLFEDLDKRYFRLIDRAPQLADEVRWDALGDYSPFESFQSIFRASNLPKESYFDSMTHFDFKTLLPALLHVEDRVSMAHGLESRVPFLDHNLVEFAATIPSNVKFQNGELKHLLRKVAASSLPEGILNRTDKMGFPVPLGPWINGPAREFVRDVFSSRQALDRSLINNRIVLEKLGQEQQFGRQVWGLLSLELWQQAFLDRAADFKRVLQTVETPATAAPTNRRAA